MDFTEIVQSIIEKVGGNDNITLVQHCMTRLRLNVKDINTADQDALKQIKGVLGAQYRGGQLQVIIGKNVIPVFDEVVRIIGKGGGTVPDDDATKADTQPEKESIGKRILAYVVGAVTSMIPAIIAGGMLKVFLVLFGYAIPGFTETSTYNLLDILSDVPFFFIPIWVAYGAARHLGATPIYAMTVAVMLIIPDFVALVKAKQTVTLFTLSVPLYNYSSKLLPTLLSTYLAYHVEKVLNKIVPGILRAIFVGMGTVVITFVPTIFILAPLGNIAGTYVIQGLLAFYANFGPLGLAVVCALMPFLIMSGMHSALSPVRVEMLATQGYDPHHNNMHNSSLYGGSILCSNRLHIRRSV